MRVRISGSLLISALAGIAARDLTTLLRAGAFGWVSPVRGSAVEVMAEIGLVIASALACRCLLKGPTGWSFAAFAVAYCLFQAPLKVFDALSDHVLPAGIVLQDGLVLAAAAAAWAVAGRSSRLPGVALTSAHS